MNDMFGTRQSGRTTKMIESAASYALNNKDKSVAIVMNNAAQAYLVRGGVIGRLSIGLANVRVTSVSELGVDFDPVTCSSPRYDKVFVDHYAVESYLKNKYSKLIEQAQEPGSLV
jgi:hypothetical protein